MRSFSRTSERSLGVEHAAFPQSGQMGTVWTAAGLSSAECSLATTLYQRTPVPHPKSSASPFELHQSTALRVRWVGQF
ncbi:monooxygenase, putative [Anopheles sinensis]|uniref:Monooxygenase, putative n=1 Tax=Anopheles sinensis TaxID=74873 RepID=A0A084WKD5_ANOSI|nr:monooxygenase, putative [Anopheles sinensis]